MKTRDLQEENVDLLKGNLKVNTTWYFIWRGINAVMALFFGLATIVNINDSDWYLWVPIYIIPTLLCLAVVISPAFSETNLWKYTAILHFTLCLVYAVWLTVIVIEIIFGKKMNPLIHEEGREFFGLLIVMGWLAVCRFTPFGRSTAPKGMANALLIITGIFSLLPMVIWSLCMVKDWADFFGHCNGMFTKKEL